MPVSNLSDDHQPHVLLPPESAPDAQHATPASSVRYPWLDVARALAIVDVVALHSGGVHVLWGLGLPVFLLCSIGLAARRSPPRPFLEQARIRSARILVPYAFWCGIYLAFNVLYWKLANGYVFVLPNQLQAWHLLVGTEFNLWYLSFIYLAEIAVAAWLTLTLCWHGKAQMGAAVLWMLLGVVAMLLATPVEDSEPIARALWSMQRAIPVVIWGMAFAVAMRNWPVTKQPLCFVGATGILIGLTSAWWVHAVPRELDPEWVWRCGLALAIVCGCVVLPGVHLPRWARAAIGLTFGIYLTHRLVIWPTGTLFDALGWSRDHLWAAVWCEAALLTWGLQRVPIVRRFVGVM